MLHSSIRSVIWSTSVNSVLRQLQTLVSSILLRAHPKEKEQTMLSATSHIRLQTEQTRVEVVKWLRRRWIGVMQAGGFDKLEGWSLKELSYGENLCFSIIKTILTRMNLPEIDVSISDLLNPEIPEYSPYKSTVTHRSPVLEELDVDDSSMHSVRTGAGSGMIVPLQETLTESEGVRTSVTSVHSAASSSLSTAATPREDPLRLDPPPDQQLTLAPLPVVSPTGSVLSTDQNHLEIPESWSVIDYALKSPGVRVDSSTLRKPGRPLPPPPPELVQRAPKTAPSSPSAWTSVTSEIHLDNDSSQIARPELPTWVVKPEVPVSAWRQLISHPLPTEKRVTLIMAIFSNKNEVGEVNHLRGDDAQTFVDVIDEVGKFLFFHLSSIGDLKLCC